MKITERRSGDVVILEFSGRLSIGDGDAEARDKIRELLGAGEKKILLGMDGVSTLDSSGVGELVAARNAAMKVDAVVKLAKLSPKVGAVLKSTHLTGVFEIFESLDDGLKSFA